MISFNGTGVRFYGYTDRQPDGSVAATKWLSLFWLPLLPLRRLTIRATRYARRGDSELPFEVLASGQPRLREVLRTYVFGWIIMPLLLSWPLVVLGFAERLGLRLPATRGLLHGGGVTEWLFIGAIVYLGVALVMLKRWDEKRAFPNQEERR